MLAELQAEKFHVSSRLFLKLFIAYAGLILLAVGACSAIVSGWQEEQLIEQVERRLRD